MGILSFIKRGGRYFDRKLNPQKADARRYNRPCLKIGKSLLFGSFYMHIPKAELSKNYVTIGDDSMVGGNFTFNTSSGEVIIGNRVYLAGGNAICINRIEVEDDVFVSWGVYLFDNDSHSLNFEHRHIDMQNHLADWKNGQTDYNFSKDWAHVKSAPIKICKNAWIGMNVTILKGVTVGEGAIVAAASVVTKDVPAWTVVAGNPATVVKYLPQHESQHT
ncbi:MAG: acyltransferase [Chitinophagaceae bacterium]